jgi:ferritin-like metal-binding protein YciE
MARVNQYPNLAAMAKKLGDAEVHRLAERQLANEQYRKERNVKQQAIVDAVKADPRFETIKKEVEAKLAAGRK